MAHVWLTGQSFNSGESRGTSASLTSRIISVDFSRPTTSPSDCSSRRTMSRILLSTIVLALLAPSILTASTNTSSGTSALDSDDARALNQSKQLALQYTMNDSFSGVWGVFRNDEPMFHATFGYANVENQVPMQYKSAMQIASNTKLFTTVAMYQLQEQGKVNLSDPIHLYLDQQDFVNFGFPNQSEYCPKVNGQGPCQNVTFTQLFAMNSGLPLMMDLAHHLDVFFEFYNGSIGHYVGLFINEPLLFPPGTQYAYSNPNFLLAGYFIEKFSGVSLQAYFQTNIFDRVGLQDTHYDPYDGAYHVVKNTASQYYRYYDGQTMQSIATGSCEPGLHNGAISGSGGIVSTLEDLVRWYLDLFGNQGQDSKVLTQNSIKQLVKPHSVVAAGYTGLGAFFAQGVTVSYGNQTAPSNSTASTPPGPKDWPDHITYCGDALCAITCIDMKFDNYSGDSLISAAFSNMGYVVFNNATSYQSAQNGPPLLFKLLGGDPAANLTIDPVVQVREALMKTWDFDAEDSDISDL